MPHIRTLLLISFGALFFFNGPACVVAQSDVKQPSFSAEQVDFFENKIRPLLIKHCLECHGSENAENGFRLDSREAILKGGDSEEAGAIPGNAIESLIVRSVRHQSDYDMPPTGQISDEEIADLVAWVQMKMPWPADHKIAKATMPELIKEHRQEHWSFQPVKKPDLPGVQNRDQVESPIDQLILKKLESNELNFSKIADRRTLIRRASFDLLGLPPTPETVERFIKDDRPDAFARLVDQLLESKHYGERWARHWLDVARYSDTSGYKLNQADRNYPFAFTYRDYVIDAFNNDLPYNQFVREQLAADYLDVPKDKSTLAALGFITVGRKYLSRYDTVDDQVDVVTRGLMGLTVACARCHDHKYDAIPTKDYYSLFAVFDNCNVPAELPLMGTPETRAKFKAFFTELEKRKQHLANFDRVVHEKLQKQMDDELRSYLVHAIALDDAKIESLKPAVLSKDDLNLHAIHRWRNFIKDRAANPVWQPLIRLRKIPLDQPDRVAEKIAKALSDMKGKPDFNPRVVRALMDRKPNSMAEVASVYGDLLASIRNRWVKGGKKKPPTSQFKNAELELARLLFDQPSPAEIKRDQITQYIDETEDELERRKVKTRLNEHNSATPDGIRRAMVLEEKENPHNIRVMIRGNHNNLGDEVPRQFVSLIDPNRTPFKNRAGRLELAEAIVDPANPLTARVLVNRIWMHHFSKPLVDTPSDFGIRCEPPLQQELLDWLAADFVENGWSIKHLHRRIMLSRAYRQSSNNRPDAFSVDPENRLLWKMNRRRLEFEALRDSMLFVAGNLDPTIHGKAFEVKRRWSSMRRTIYAKIDRQDLPNLFRAFDLASPDQSAAKRIRTTVPQQSLFMMNNRFAIQQAKVLAGRAASETKDHTDPGKMGAARIEKLYELMFQREPTKEETKIALDFLVQSHSEARANKKDNDNTADGLQETNPDENTPKKKDGLAPLQQLAQMLMCANEFEFVD